MTVFRIADYKYLKDLTGRGAAMYGGRWNSKNTYIVYTAENRALALLEILVHIGVIPEKGFGIATILIPDNSITTLTADQLPYNWDKNPPPDFLKTIGDNFIRANQYVALKIPSALMQEDSNFLLNPAHKDFDKVKIQSHRLLNVDDRLFPVAKS